jgi:hypothetical protein
LLALSSVAVKRRNIPREYVHERWEMMLDAMPELIADRGPECCNIDSDAIA